MAGNNKKLSVLVTCKWPDAVEAEIAKHFGAKFISDESPLSPSQLIEALRTHDVIMATVTNKLTREVFESGGLRTKLIANFGVGFNHIDAVAAKKQGIIVSNTPGVLTDCTADTALLLMLMAARRATEGEKLVRLREWKGFGPTHFLGTRLTGKTLGVIGMGRIGQATAHRCHYGFGMPVVFHNRSKIDNEAVRAMGARQLATIEDVMASADFISIHCPGGAENRHLVNRARIGRMKKTAFLINTARGEVVDEEALADALESGAIAGAGLDVFENEPNVNPRLIAAPNASLLPHLGSATQETRLAMANKALENLIAYAEGRAVPNRVN